MSSVSSSRAAAAARASAGSRGTRPRTPRARSWRSPACRTRELRGAARAVAARVDGARDRVSPVSAPAEGARGTVDLHLHSSASDGAFPPATVMRRAAAAGLKAVALTDHDTLAGVPAAIEAGERLGLRVVSGCEFSVAAPWGEMHVLGYFLPPGSDSARAVSRRLPGRPRAPRPGDGGAAAPRGRAAGRGGRAGRGRGRSHRAARTSRARWCGGGMSRRSARRSIAIWRRGRPAFVDKTLPTFAAVAALVHQVGGIVSAAHLKERGTRAVLQTLRVAGAGCGGDAPPEPRPGSALAPHRPRARARLAAHRRQRLAR